MTRLLEDGHRPRGLERDDMAWPPASWERGRRAGEWSHPVEDGSPVFDCGVDAAAPRGGSDLEAASRRAERAWLHDLGGAARDVVQTVVLAIVLFLGMRVVVQNYVIESFSMEPTLVEGQHIWVNKLVYAMGHGPERGDIVVFQSWNQEKPFIKRVVGLPGETLEFRDGRVYVDGEPVWEPYLEQETIGADRRVALADDEFFVMGDNRGHSGDSRHYGPLPAEDVIGKAWMRYWPLDQLELLGPGSDGRSFAAGN